MLEPQLPTRGPTLDPTCTGAPVFVREGPRNATSRHPRRGRRAQYPCPQTSEHSTTLATAFGIEGGSQAKGSSLPMYHGLQDERLQKRTQPGPH